MENHRYEDEGKFQRKMTSRHLFMLSLGGVIGTGLFLSSGYTIAQAGPLGAVLSYLIGAVVVYLVMLSLGELAVAMPVTGSFHTYATKFISPGTGFTVAWLYWICWTVALGTEFLGAAMLMQRWFPNVPAWAFVSFFALVIFGLNALSVRFFAEAESFFSSIKVIAIIIFIILGLGAMFGLVSFEGQHKAILFTHLTANGAFPNGIVAVVSVMLAVNYAFSGTELIGIAAGETIPNAQEAEALIELLAEDFPQVEAYMSFTSQDGKTISDGSAVADLAKAIDVSPQVVALGINCSSPSLVADFLQAIAEQTNKPLVTYPNSGEVYDGASQSWQSSPDHSHTLLENTSDWQKLGAQVVGGCCRTRPADIADLSAHLK